MKKILITIAIVVIVIFIINKKDMTLRQSLLKVVYPVLMAKEKIFSSRKSIIKNTNHVKPPAPFYDLSAQKINGEVFNFNELKGKKVLLVNTASDCGYTPQYDELQQLYKRYAGKLVVIGFPANDFKQQEKAGDKDIEQFCKLNYGVTFPLMKKSTVKKGEQQNAVYKWLTDRSLNGWNTRPPEWNFSKYLIHEHGTLTHYFAPKVSPLSKEVTSNL